MICLISDEFESGLLSVVADYVAIGDVLIIERPILT